MEKEPIWEEENTFEIQNRIQNLMWTVSGDYGLDAEVDPASFRKSKYIALYDAIKQGGFARYFDQEQFRGYLVRKVYLGAEVSVLMRFAQLCMDSAVWKKLERERPGVPDIRRKAFEDTLDLDFGRLTSSQWGKVEGCYLRQSLYQMQAEKRIQRVLDRITALSGTEDTMEVIRCLDEVYNEVFDKGFTDKFHGLEEVLRVSDQELKEYDWKDYLEEEARESRAENLVNRFQEQMLLAEEEEKERRKGGNILLLDEESVAKMQNYIELNYGKSYLPHKEQMRLSRQICRGAHADSCLHFTDGILSSMVKVNSQSEYARKVKEINLRVLLQNQRVAKQNIQVLANVLKRALVTRTEKEICTGDYGKIRTDKLWNVGRTKNRRLFEREIRRDNSDFVVEVLIDASGSQRARQSQVALQAYIISEALSMAGIAQRVMGFCTFWDYTVMRRFRDYEEGREANERIFEFYGSANNRDGLAIRAAADSLEKRPEENKILIVLSDGRPNDLIVNRPHSRNPKPYCGEYAVKDTALEVRRLRNRGVAVLGVFTGKEEDLQAEKRIYGKDFAYIRDIANFSNVVGRYLKKQLLD
ncbi:MAG: hypothetical protein Q4F41_12295 [Eubacteriales bacterium]|nr:hypothetical protein [Eubacteriales bacterium]